MRKATLRKVKGTENYHPKPNTPRRVGLASKNVTDVNIKRPLRDSSNIMKKDLAKLSVATRSGRIATSFEEVGKGTRQQLKRSIGSNPKTQGDSKESSPKDNNSNKLRRSKQNKEETNPSKNCNLDGSTNCKNKECDHSKKSNKSPKIVKKIKHNVQNNKAEQSRGKQNEKPNVTPVKRIGRKNENCTVILKKGQTQRKYHNDVESKKAVVVKENTQMIAVKQKLAERTVEELEKTRNPKTRRCKPVNYRLSHLDATTDKKVPIYRQLKEESKENQKRNIYEFNARDEDSDVSLCVNTIDREMHEFLQNIKQKEVKMKKKKTVRKQVKFSSDSTKPLAASDNKGKALKQMTDSDLRRGVEIAQKKPTITVLSNISIVPSQIENSNVLKENSDLCIVPSQIENSNVLMENSDLCIVPSQIRNSNVLKEDHEISFRRPNANSTMVSCPSPWRPNLVVRGTPHLLLTKSSNLPIYEQDLVLNSTLVEKNSPRPASLAPKRQKQSTILSYFGDTSNKENELELSLFDENLLSPIKRSNRSPTKRINKSPRKVLGEYNFQQREPSSNDQSDFSFGFNNSTAQATGTAKPARISVGELRKVFGKQEKVNEEVIHLSSEAPSTDVIEEFDGPVPDLFEDLRKKSPENTYSRKKTKRQRYVSVHDEETEDEEQPLKKRRKDVRRNSWDKEAEEWAASFNAMCEEVEAYPLEIE